MDRNAAPAETAEQGSERESAASGVDVVALFWTFAKYLGWLLPVYLAGYLGLSLVLVMVGLMVYMGWKVNRGEKQKRMDVAMQLLQNEERMTQEKMYKNSRDLPAWVNFPDVEKAEWLNKVLKQAWPFLGQFMEKLLVESIAPSIRSSNAHLQTFAFTKVDLGEKPIRVIGVKAHTEMNKHQVLLDVYISYVGDVEINVEVKKYLIKAGVKGIQLHGMLRVILEPMISNPPFFGAITMFFIQRPRLEINWTGMTNLLDIPGLSSLSDTKIMDSIASFLVLPNRLTVPIVADVQVAQLRSPLPRGIVRIYLIEAQNLTSKDNFMKGVIKGKSDPYAIVRVGTQVFISKVIDENLNPRWNEMYEVIVHEVPGQELELEIFDKDPDKDDFLGRMKMDLGDVKKTRSLDQWYQLKDTEKGQVHLRLEWLSLLTNPSSLDQVLQVNRATRTTFKTSDPPSAAILAVYLDRAQELPLKNGSKNPNPMVQLSVQDVTKESRTCYGTNSPVWEDAFHFFIQNPKTQELDLHVKDDDRVLALGSLTLPLSRLLSSENLTLDQWFQLDHSGSASRLYMKIVLRILASESAGAPKSPVSTSPCLPTPGEVLPKPSDPPKKEEEKAAEEVVTGTSSVIQQSGAPQQMCSSVDEDFTSEGVLRIHLVEAENLIAKDNFLKGMMQGKSDPYVVIRAGAYSFRSRVIKENLNPKWGELYEVVMTMIPGQELEFELFDKDIDEDDFLGRLKINMLDITTNQYTDEWFTLSEVKSGSIHLILEWLPRIADTTALQQIIHMNSLASYQNKVHPSAAILYVYLDRGHSLPFSKAQKPPKAGAELSLGNLTYRSKMCDRSTDPVWGEAFHFLVQNPLEDLLLIKLKHDWSLSIGSLVISLKDLLTKPDLTLDKWLPLDGAGTDSQILLRATLRILKSTALQAESMKRGIAEPKIGHPEPDSTTPEDHHRGAVDPPAVTIPSKDTPSSAQDVRQRAVSSPSKSGQEESSLGQVRLTIQYVDEEHRLVLLVHSCRKLKPCSKDGSDPYVSLILLPDKNRVTKRKTAVKKKSLNPDFNERFDFEMAKEEVRKRKLEVSVKNSVSFMSRERELIGKVLIDLSQADLSSGVGEWYDLKEGDP
ncbi:extended synaptotagmin-1 isoform X2 [Polypterus senegalus]|uniref:extended synaptotagmin-1 isoform X2 n=1 Tax=Polypterus senegalus TaxID=55291 RepID=UPI001964E15F|nr:extended synaptotagmin-1 isoform X2 [Polypterus senegalus]